MDVPQYVEGDQSEFKTQQVIAKGLQSVYAGTNVNTGEAVCIKIVELTEKELPKFKASLKDWQSLKGVPGVLQLKSYYIWKERDVYFAHTVTELAITSLDRYLNKCFETHKYFTNVELIQFITTTLSILADLQQKNIAHRNLKPENILLMNVDTKEWRLCDFRDSANLDSQQNTQTRTLTGGITHLSPELFESYRRLQFNPKYNPYKSDIFSLALIWVQAASFYRFSMQSRNSLKGQKYQEALRNLILSVVHRYPEIGGLQEVLEIALAADPAKRADPVQLQQIIKERGYLHADPLAQSDPKSIIQATMEQRPTDRNGYIRLQVPKDFSHIEFYNLNPELCQKAFFDMTDLWVLPEDFLLLTEKLLQITTNYSLLGLKLSFELDGIDERHVFPLNALIASQTVSELQIAGWNNQLRDPGLRLLLQNIKLETIEKFQLGMSLYNNYLKDRNNLTDKSFQFVVDLVLKMPKLKHLNLDFSMNQMTTAAQLLITQLKDIKLLTLQINLETNQVNDRFCQELLVLHKGLQKLKLNVSSTQVSDQGLIHLGTLIEQLPELMSLSITAWNTDIKDKGLMEFLRSLEKAVQLRKLLIVLRQNKITAEHKHLWEALSLLKNLEELEVNLSSTSLGDNGATTFCKAIVGLEKLRSLTLKIEKFIKMTKIPCRYIARLPANVKSITHLTLNLSLNKLGPEGLELLSAGLRLSQNLEYLELVLDSVECGDEGCQFLAKGLRKQEKCKEIIVQMGKNGITSIGYQAIEESLLKLSPDTLQRLRCDFRLNFIELKTEQEAIAKFRKYPKAEIKLYDQ